jgi:drug/metabolite transporter (DMT)-like permease
MAFVLILCSVAFHASWNLIAKKVAMSVAFYTLLCTTALACSHIAFYWTPVEYFSLPREFYIFTILTVISDCTYCMGLVGAYRRMDMSTAYPLMRSLPLLLTMLLTMVLGWGAKLPWYAVIGMVLAFVGCMCMPLKKFSDFNWKYYLSGNIFFVLLAACGTTGYTVFDSKAQGVMAAAYPELSKVVISLSYYGFRGVFLVTALTTIVMLNREERKNWFDFWKKRNFWPMLGGVAGAFAYGTVLVAMNYVSNVTYVQMLRLLALPLGLFTGIFILKERGTVSKFTGVALILTGLLLTIL